MKSVVNVVQSVTRMLSSRTNHAETEIDSAPDGDSQSSLYACRSCDSVYIATEKQTCQSCGTAVEQVPATLDEA